jgi:two-component system KDP operon response regulator KdpE
MAGPILIVEDDPTLMRSIARNLEARAYVILRASSVADADRAMAQVVPALVLLDIDLPDGSGWEVLRTLRAAGHADVPAIIMSALRPNHRLVEELGATGVLEKPFPMESLVRLVAECFPQPASEIQVDSKTAD